LVQDITRGNRYFERPESVREYEQNGSSLLEQFPAAAWDTATANCLVLGTWQNNALARSAYPPAPGTKVKEANEEMLKPFLGFREDGLHVGKLMNHDVPVKLGLSALLQKHVAILAMSGAGKSHLANVLLEELLDRKKEHGRMAIVALDIHGEYSGLGDSKINPTYAPKVKVIDAEEITIATRELLRMPELLSETSPVAMRELQKLLEKLREEKKSFDLEELYEAANAADINKNVKDPLLDTIGQLQKLQIFSKVDNPEIRKSVKSGQALIIDFSKITDLKTKQVIASYFGKKLFSLRQKHEIPPFLLLVEEAHNFAPEKMSKENAISKGIIEKIAREGRKFGANICLVSQRPVNLSTTALSQCNTFFILRIMNPNDLDQIRQSAEGIDARTLEQISGLKVGEGILLGEAVQAPVFVRVRARNSRPGNKATSLEKMAQEFEDTHSNVTDEDVKTFL
jgi:hypothetical protein